MPVNFQTMQSQIREMGNQAGPRAREWQERLEMARQALQEHAADLDEVKRRVDQARLANSGLRCAVPVNEHLDHHAATPELTCPYVLFAADGSQVVPSHHDAVEFGVINVGAIRIFPGSALTPSEIVESKLLCFDEVHTRDGYLLTEEVIALMRDVAERRKLAELARAEKLPVVALTDGQLEIYGRSKASAELEERLKDYERVMEQLGLLNVTMAGYVAKPQSDLVIRLLELFFLDDSELSQAGEKRPLRGVSDTELFYTLLQPGERSAVYSIQSKSAFSTQPGLVVHFFYVNVCQSGRPHLARVEVPGWVAEDESRIDLLHYAVCGQCRQMGSRPYPYALHRAHEVAVVSLEERAELENMIALELRRRGVEVGLRSDKQEHKLLSGRRRWSL